MKALTLAVCAAVALARCPVSAQVVVLDQESPGPRLSSPTSFNLDDPLRWIQQIRAGRTGTLAAIEIGVTGPIGAQCHLWLRPGPITPLQPRIFETLVIKESAVREIIRVDVRSAALELSPGDLFQMETQGTHTGMWLLGNGPPAMYPQPLWVDQGGFLPARHGFTTYVLTDCYADCDENGEIDFFDFLCYQQAFASDDPYADCNQSGALTITDYLCFTELFAAGCS